MAKGSRGGKRAAGGGVADKNTNTTNKKESNKKMPATGAKVQEAFISDFKKHTGIDLTNARETRFDNRRYFNIDVSKMGRNDYNTLSNYVRRYGGSESTYQLSLAANGANRVAIFVKRNK